MGGKGWNRMVDAQQSDHPDALRVVVSWQTGEGGGRVTYTQAQAHPDWPTACDHMRRLLDVPGAMEITVRRGA